MNERGLKVKVGLVVLVALAFFVGFVLLLGTFSLGEQRTFYVELADSGSLLAGAPVKIAGVRAGRVEAVAFIAPGERQSAPRGPQDQVNVRLTLSVDAALVEALRQDSELYVTSQGVLGEKYLEIMPGSPTSPAWAPGATLRGEDPARLDLLMSRAERLLVRVETAMGGKDDLQVEEMISSLARVAANLDGFLTQHRARLDRIVTNLDEGLVEGRLVLKALAVGLGDGQTLAATLSESHEAVRTLNQELRPTATRARQALQEVEAAAKAGRAFIEATQGPLTRVLADAGPALSTLLSAGERLKAVADQLLSGQGTLGQLLMDPQVHDDLREVLRDVKRHPWKLFWRE